MLLKSQTLLKRLMRIMGLFVTFSIMGFGAVHYYTVRKAVMKDVYDNQLIMALKAHQGQFLITIEKAIEAVDIVANDPAFVSWFGSSKEDSVMKAIALERLDFLNDELDYPAIFAVNRSTLEYWYKDNILLDIVSEDDPDDAWFFKTIRGGLKSQLNFDHDNNLNRSMLFVNAVIGDTQDPLGVAGIGIDPSILIHQFEHNKPSEDTRLWLLDQQGKILLSERLEEVNTTFNGVLDSTVVGELLGGDDEQIIREITFKGRTCEMASMRVGQTQYRVVMVIPQRDLLAILNVISYNTIWLTVLVLLLTLVVASLLARSISKPILHLAQLSSDIAHARLNIQVKDKLLKRSDEIGKLATAFDAMQKQLARTIDRLNQANIDLKNERQQLRDINSDLSAAIQKAAENEKLTKAFMANISHEIRTPMNSIMGFAQLLEEDLRDQSDLQAFAAIIVKNGTHLLAILNNIIEVAKMDSGLTKPSYTTFSVKEVIKDSLGLFAFKAGNTLTLINRAQEYESDCLLYSDVILVKRLLNNLISNAVKYTPHGSVEVGFHVDGDHVIFYVADSGIGIDTTDQDSIFKPFWQVKHARSVNEGAGLGLAISQKMVELLSGRIWVDSAPDKGSIFYVSLPLHHK